MKTNRDVINSISNEELANIFVNCDCTTCIYAQGRTAQDGEDWCKHDCFEGIKIWLESEIEKPSVTNFDKVSEMGIDELADLLYSGMCGRCIYNSNTSDCALHSCYDGIKSWLLSNTLDTSK